jgi:hypothetical protein
MPAQGERVVTDAGHCYATGVSTRSPSVGPDRPAPAANVSAGGADGHLPRLAMARLNVMDGRMTASARRGSGW